MKPDPSLGFCDIEIDQEMLRYFKMFLLLTSYMYTYNTIDQAKKFTERVKEQQL